MLISSAEFIKGVIGSEGLPEPTRPSVAFFGRSNVGKSSVINSLVNQRDLARSSSRPGRTTEINYFLINGAWYLVDTPGYGYAKLSLSDREKIRKRLLWFATDQEVRLETSVVIIDAEVGMRDSDREICALLSEAGRNIVIVANKSDKGRRNDVMNNIREVKQELPKTSIIRYSAKTGEGMEELLRVLFSNENQARKSS